MKTITTCLIVKNEASCIARCLNSLISFSDEIIVYDTGSDDGTQDICRSFEKVKLIQGEWRDDFAWARNQSFKYATCEYVMWVDADDAIDEKSQEWIINYKNSDNEYNVVKIEYVYDMNEDGTYTTTFYRARIIRKDLFLGWESKIHEFIKLDFSKAIFYEAPFDECKICHYKHETNPKRNLLIFHNMEKNGEINSGREWFYYGRETLWHEDKDLAIARLKKSLEYEDIWKIDKLNALKTLAIIYKDDKEYQKALEYAYMAAACTYEPRADVCCMLYYWGLLCCNKKLRMGY